MKNPLLLIAVIAASTGLACGQAGVSYLNVLRQVQLPDGVEWDVQVPDEGAQASALPIFEGGAQLELWTLVDDVVINSFLLDHKFVSSYAPVAEVRIATEDPYDVIPRTRADRPFNVVITPHGLLPQDDPEAPDASKQVTLMRHVQSYGPDGTGETIDRSQAMLLNQVALTENKNHLLRYLRTSIPSTDPNDLTKVRGEERFSVFTLDHHDEDYKVDASQIATLTMQVWPVAEGSIAGISDGEILRFNTPQITLTLKDLYPDSRTYAQIYPGAPTLGTEGTVISGSAWVIYDAVPGDRTLVLDKWDTAIDQDGLWTMELLTATPFGTDRLAYVTFNVNRSIEVRGSVTTID